jgi:hypothetical protein
VTPKQDTKKPPVNGPLSTQAVFSPIVFFSNEKKSSECRERFFRNKSCAYQVFMPNKATQQTVGGQAFMMLVLEIFQSEKELDNHRSPKKYVFV